MGSIASRASRRGRIRFAPRRRAGGRGRGLRDRCMGWRWGGWVWVGGGGGGGVGGGEGFWGVFRGDRMKKSVEDFARICGGSGLLSGVIGGRHPGVSGGR